MPNYGETRVSYFVKLVCVRSGCYCPFTLTNVTATLPSPTHYRSIYKSNPVVKLVLAEVIDHSARRGYQPSLASVISRTGASPVGY